MNPATSDQPYIGISFERRVVGGWNLALESADRVSNTDSILQHVNTQCHVVCFSSVCVFSDTDLCEGY